MGTDRWVPKDKCWTVLSKSDIGEFQVVMQKSRIQSITTRAAQPLVNDAFVSHYAMQSYLWGVRYIGDLSTLHNNYYRGKSSARGGGRKKYGKVHGKVFNQHWTAQVFCLSAAVICTSGRRSGTLYSLPTPSTLSGQGKKEKGEEEAAEGLAPAQTWVVICPPRSVSLPLSKTRAKDGVKNMRGGKERRGEERNGKERTVLPKNKCSKV